MTARPGSRSSVPTLSRRRFVAGASATGFVVAHGRRLAQAQSSAISITRGPTGQPVVALTFDSGGDRGYAGSILDTLANAGIRASFGITGQWAESNGDLVQRIAAEGHVLINHSYTHASFTGRSTGTAGLSSAGRRTELDSTERVLTSLTGRGGRPYFRPPYGDYDASVLADLGAAGFTHNVLWSLDALGWKGLTQDQIVNRVLSNHGNGYIYLMHVFSQSQEGPALPRIISGLRGLGYGFATIPQLLAGSAPSPPPPAPAGFTAGERVQVTAGLYLRATPNLGGRVSTTMPTGTVCTVVSGPNPADGYTWYQLDTPYGRGWAAGEFLRRTSLAPSPPPPSPPPAAGGFKTGERVRVTAGLYLRTAANRSSGVLTTMPTGTVCTIVSGPSPADGLTWYQVDSPYGRGWAAGEYLERTAAAPSPPPPASGAFKAGDTVRVTAGLYLRTEPNRSSGVLTTMPRGTTCTVVSGPSPADSLTWYQVDTPYGRGWAAGEYLARV